MMKTLTDMQPVVAELRHLAAFSSEKKTIEAYVNVDKRRWYEDLQGYTQGFGLGAKGVVMLGAAAFGGAAAVGQVVNAVGPFFDSGVNAAVSFQRAQGIKPQFKEQIFHNGYQGQKEKGRSMKELEDQMRQSVKELGQQRAEAARRAASAAG